MSRARRQKKMSQSPSPQPQADRWPVITDEQWERIAFLYGMPEDFYMETSRETGLDPLHIAH